MKLGSMYKNAVQYSRVTRCEQYCNLASVNLDRGVFVILRQCKMKLNKDKDEEMDCELISEEPGPSKAEPKVKSNLKSVPW
jgi:hypothetical protein